MRDKHINRQFPVVNHETPFLWKILRTSYQHLAGNHVDYAPSAPH